MRMIFCAFLLAPTISNAEPIRFDWIGSWSSFFSFPFASSYTASIVFDNGSTSPASQTYTQSDFVSASLTSGFYTQIIGPDEITEWLVDFSSDGSGRITEGWFNAVPANGGSWHFDPWFGDANFTSASDIDAGYFESNTSTVGVLLQSEQVETTILLNTEATEIREDSGTTIVSVIRVGENQLTSSVDFALVSGSATAGEDFIAKAGTLIFEPGEVVKTVAVEVIDDAVEEPAPDETFTLVLSKAVDAVLGPNQKILRIVDDETNIIPTIFVDFDASSFNKQVNETVGTAKLQVNLSEPAPQSISVSYEVQASSATAGEDFVPCNCPEILTIPEGATMAFITIAIIDDQEFEPQETLAVILTEIESSPEVGLGEYRESKVRIVSDDPFVEERPTVALDPATLVVQEDTGPFFLSVTRSGDTSEAASVDYVVTAGSAVAGEDYTANNGTLTFSPGATSASILLRIVDDALNESPPDETFTVSLTNPVNVELGASSTQITIVDNDENFPPALRTLRTDGLDTSAVTYGGVSTDMGGFYIELVNVGENIAIYVTLKPTPEEIGKNASIVVVVRSEGNHVQVTPIGVIPLEITTIEETVPRLIPFAELTLTERVNLNLLQFLGGSLPLTVEELGSYEIFVGYTIDDISSGTGIFTYNDEAINLTIEQ